jgi:hypothetical protein
MRAFCHSLQDEPRRARSLALSAEPLAFLRLLNRLSRAVKNFMASPKSHSFTRPRCRRSTYLRSLLFTLTFFLQSILRNSPPRHKRIIRFLRGNPDLFACPKCKMFLEEIIFSRCADGKIKWAGQKSSRGDNWRGTAETFAWLIRAARREGRKQPLCGWRAKASEPPHARRRVRQNSGDI